MLIVNLIENFRPFGLIFQFMNPSFFWLLFIIYNNATNFSTVQISMLFVALYLFIDGIVDVFVVVYYSRSAHFVLARVTLAAPRKCLYTFRNLFVNKVALRFVVFLVVLLEVQLVVQRARHFSTTCDMTIYFHLSCFLLLSLLNLNFSDCVRKSHIVFLWRGEVPMRSWCSCLKLC